jgi:hypothetical protein
MLVVHVHTFIGRQQNKRANNSSSSMTRISETIKTNYPMEEQANAQYTYIHLTVKHVSPSSEERTTSKTRNNKISNDT